ncbi:TIGR01244 family sulfur transferase [Rhodobaculum claviforme]|uniref:TIGR01244 family protein n=1 Tax=Rhodobaculum claviforme TaxID=1549854 RepID=A0A934WI94_9RHOB|nr:TIGR01244 family sulfur transferase [Rhodobaculum claviforme]MBK5926522.1 TIGR01244 family protein [Rhodobaculum claviforme]
MDIRPLSDSYAVSPQIAPEDVPAIAAAGYTTVICNRPDAENPPDLAADRLRAAVEAAGMTFLDNPFDAMTLSRPHVDAQAAAMAGAAGPVLAYCASGNRSSVVWALAQAGRQPADALIGAGARHGYRLEGLRPQIEALAAERG